MAYLSHNLLELLKRRLHVCLFFFTDFTVCVYFFFSFLFLADKRMSRTPRRAQQPKTLNTPEDSTYYNLIHVSPCEDAPLPEGVQREKLKFTFE